MNKLQIFNSAEFGEIRTVTIDNEPWFVGKDVAEALGYSNTRDALATHVSEEDKNNLFKNCFSTFMAPFSITVCFFSFLSQKLIHEIQLSLSANFCRACDSY